MARNRLFLISTIFILFLAEVIGAKIISTNIEDGIKSSVEAYSEQTRIKMEIADLSSNWFSTDFRLKIYLPTPFVKTFKANFDTQVLIDDNQNFGQLFLDQHIEHGPIAFTKNGPRLGLAYWESEANLSDEILNNLLSNNELSDEKKDEIENIWPQIKKLANIKLDGHTNFLGTITNNIHSTGGSVIFHSDKKSLEVKIDPLEILWTLNSSYDASEIQFSWSGMSIKSPDEIDVTINDIFSKAQIQRIKPDIWLGNSDFHLGQIYGKGPENTQFEFLGLDATSSVNMDLIDDSFTFDMQYNAKNFNLNSSKNNVNFDGFNLNASISKIPFSFIEKLMAFSESVNSASQEEINLLGLEFFEWISTLDYNGNIKVAFNSNTLLADVNKTQNSHIKMQPMNITYSLDNKNKISNFDMDWNGINLDIEDNLSFSLGSITSFLHQFKISPSLWLGSSEIKFSDLKIRDNNNRSFGIKNIALEGSVLPLEDNIFAQANISSSLENVSLDTLQDSMMIKTHNSHWVVKNIPLEFIELYQDMNSSFKIENFQNPDSNNEEALKNLFELKLQPVINMDNFDLTLKSGTFKSNATATFREPLSINSHNPLGLLDLNAELEFSELFIHELLDITAQQNPQIAAMSPEQRNQMVKMQLMQFIQQGLIMVSENNKYKSVITTINNFIAVNGNPMFPLPATIIQ